MAFDSSQTILLNYCAILRGLGQTPE